VTSLLAVFEAALGYGWNQRIWKQNVWISEKKRTYGNKI